MPTSDGNGLLNYEQRQQAQTRTDQPGGARQAMADGIRKAEYREQAKAWYKSAAWQRLRKHQLDKHPYCQCPIHKGENKAYIATVADHIEPHRGDKHKFFNGKLQSLTAVCHNGIKQQIERSGTFTGADEQGNPLDQRSAWWQS